MSQRRVGTRWVDLLTEHGIGASASHPVETQRVAFSLAARTPGRMRREMQTEWVIDATLDDLDVTARFARHELGVTGEDRRSLQRTVDLFDRQAAQLAAHPAFRQDRPVSSAYKPLAEYRAWRCRGEDRYFPLRRLAPSARVTEGVLVPYQLTSPRTLSHLAIWVFSPVEDPVPPEATLRAVRRSPTTTTGRVD